MESRRTLIVEQASKRRKLGRAQFMSSFFRLPTQTQGKKNSSDGRFSIFFTHVARGVFGLDGDQKAKKFSATPTLLT